MTKFYYVAKSSCNPSPSMHHWGPFKTKDDAVASVDVQEVMEWAKYAQEPVVYEILEIDVATGQMEKYELCDYDFCDDDDDGE